MNKLFATLSTIFLLCFTIQAQVVINEFMSNAPGGGTDSLEFIELYNAGVTTVDISNWSFSQGVTHTFATGTTIAAGGYIVIVYDSTVFMNYFGIAGIKFSGGLSNGGEDITLINNLGVTIDSVDYGGSGWTTTSNTDGWSMELCNIAGDHNNAANWYPGSNATGVFFNAIEVLATPGAANTCTVPPAVNYPVYTFNQINGGDGNGVADSLTVTCELRGIAHCIDFRVGTGIDFPFASSNWNNGGIRVFSYTDVNNYTVTEGDSLHISGTIAQYNGLLQFIPDSIAVISQANATMWASPFGNSLGEYQENRLVYKNNVHLVDTSEWSNSISGFNVRVTSGGNDTFTVRIDDATDLYNQPAPLDTFNITGWGGQYDNSSPYTEGYQLMPCGMSMITGNSMIVQNNDVLTIFPNPASTVININSSFEIEKLWVFNTLGQELLSRNNINDNTMQINTFNLENGIYIISVVSGNKMITQQFQVIK